MLRVEQIAVRFGGVQAFADVSFEVPVGRVTGLIGPNGAGKTTLFNVVTGLQRPTRGRVFLDEKDVTGAGPQRRARAGLARTFQRLEVFGSLTTRENVLVAAEVRHGFNRGRGGPRPGQVADELINRVGLRPVAGTAANVLSTGTARWLELARALASGPKVLLLDEPSSGLDGGESEGLGKLLVALAGEGMAVLLVEHDMDLVMGICDYLHVLDFGQLIAAGTPGEIKADPRVQEAYLGAEPGVETSA
jgi:branched-chain amino acid transport system ATP-binding protein